MTLSSESRFETNYLPKTKPARKHFLHVAKKARIWRIVARSVWHVYQRPSQFDRLIAGQCSESPSDKSATSQGDHRFLPSTSFHFDKRQKKIQKTDGRLLVHRNLRYGGSSNDAHVTSVSTQALVVNPSKRFFKTDS
jgi:hypothetical protein